MAETLTRPQGMAAADPALPYQAAAGNDNTTLTASTTLVADTMYCGTCMISIEDALAAIPGVSHARVNLTTKRVSVAFDPSRTNVEAFIDAVLGVGPRPVVTGEEALAVLELALAVDAASGLPSHS